MMNSMIILQIASHTAERSAHIAERDPHGVIISLISIGIVFLSLIVLFLAYELIGVIVNRWFMKKKDGHFVVEDNLTASGRDVHDMESYVLTISRKTVPVQKTVDRAPRLNSNLSSDDDVARVQNKSLSSADSTVRSPLPGVILKVLVNEGDIVETGKPVAMLEAMKMENTIEAERNGTVKKIHVSQGDSVLEGSEIMTIE